MEITIIISLFLALIISLVVPKLFRSLKRRKCLIQANRLSNWEDLERHPERFNRIVITNCGYGQEVWAISGNVDEMDLSLRAFKNGVLIVPRPESSALEKFCRSHDISLARTLVK
jgi:hypothetical protein